MSKGEESAFPQSPASDGSASGVGLSKREHFASLAMQGLMAKEDPLGVTAERQRLRPYRLASYVVEYADALIEELKKEQK